jgi:ureidoacrylate peracid hydrolase
MHRVELPADLLQRLEARRGRLRVFDRLEPRSTALLVIDMQNAFVHPDGFACVETAAGIVPNINRLAGAVRDAGGAVAWVRVSLTAAGRGAWNMYFENFTPAAHRDEWRAQLTPGHPQHEFWPALDIDAADWIVDKDRFSAFVEGASDLEARLRRQDIDTLLVTGTLTNICCESTARDAMMRDFRTLMIADANAARTDEDHLAGLRTFVQVFGDVVATDEALRLIEAGPSSGVER